MAKKSVETTDVEMLPRNNNNASAAEAAKKKALTRGPIKNRSCTDIICFLIFFVFVAGLVVISIFAYRNGDPRRLLHPVDSDGNRCGMDNQGPNGSLSFANKTKLHFFDFSVCFTERLKNPLKAATSFNFTCSTRQICVSECLNMTQFSYVATTEQKKIWPCDYDVTEDDKTNRWRQLIETKRCAPYVVQGSSLLGRCLPVDADDMLKHVKRMVDENLKGPDEGVNSTTSSDGFKGALQRFITDMMNFGGSVDKMMADFANSWLFLVILLCISCVVCFLWIVLMRWLACPMVWFSLVAFLGIFAFGTYYCVNEYLNNATLKDEKLQWTTDISSIKGNKNTWLGLSIICGAFLFIILVTVIFLRSRIAIAIEMIKESSKAVGSIMSTLLWPIFPFLLQLAIFAGWAATMMFLVTSSVPIFVVSNSTNATAERALALNQSADSVVDGRVCDRLSFAGSYGDTGALCIYSRDGPDPNDPLYSHISGVVDNLDWAKVYVIFGLLWLINFVAALGEMTLAGAFASWYWAFDKSKDVPMFPLAASFWRCLRYHLGTLAFGSLIIAIVQMIRIMLEYVDRKLKNNENEVTKFIMKCLKCFFWCLEKFLKFINRNAYIMCAVHGRHFCASAKKAFMLILENCVRAVVLDKVVDFLLFIGKIAVIGGMGVLSFYYYSGKFNAWLPDGWTVTLHYYWAPVIIIILATYFVTCCFFSVYAMAVDTLFLCFLEDIEQNDGTPEKPYYMSKSLMKILGKRNKDPNEEEKTTGCCGCC